MWRLADLQQQYGPSRPSSHAFHVLPQQTHGLEEASFDHRQAPPHTVYDVYVMLGCFKQLSGPYLNDRVLQYTGFGVNDLEECTGDLGPSH